MSKNITRVNKNKNYTTMSNYHLKDENLSWKAKGIHSYILSLPDDWNVIIEHLKTVSTDGRDSTRSGIQELYDLRYWQRYPIHVDGKIDKWVTDIYEEPFDEDKKIKNIIIRDGVEVINYEKPFTDNPLVVEDTSVDLDTDNPHIGKPHIEKPELLNTNNTKDLYITNHSFSKDKEKLKEKESERMNEDIKTDDFKEILKNSNYTAVENQYINAIEQAIRILYYSDKPININQMRIPQHQIREDLKRLRWKHIDIAVRSFKTQSEQQEIRNVTSYLSRLIYNAIFDSDTKIDAELRYNNLI